MHKKISVIVPCYNVEHYIDRCLKSLIDQTIGLDCLTVVCVNDASTDHTWERLEAWKQRYPDTFIMINCQNNGRQGTARNIAFSYVTTPYVGYVDGDDWVEPNMYGEMYQKAVPYHCDVVFCDTIRDSSETLSLLPDNGSASWLLSIDSPEERKKFILDNTIKNGCCDKLIRTDFLSKHQIHFPERLAYEDAFFASMLYLYAETVCIMEHKFYHYYVNRSSTVLTLNRPYHKDILQINNLKWAMYEARGVLTDYYFELAFDFLVGGYLVALKILSLRYTTDTWADYCLLRSNTLKSVPDAAANPYLHLLTDFQRLQIQMLTNPLTREEWQDYCQLVQANPQMK